MGYTVGTVGYRLKVKAGEFFAFVAEFDSVILHTGKGFTIRIATENCQAMTVSVAGAASFALIFIERNVAACEKSFAVCTVFFAYIHGTVEAIFATRGCKVFVIHFFGFFLMK
jgi:hypothetical protein